MSESIVYKVTRDDGNVLYVYASGLTNLLNDPVSRGREFIIETLGPDRAELWVKGYDKGAH